MFLTAYDLCCSSSVNLKAEGQTVETENLIQKLHTQIKILANPELA